MFRRYEGEINSAYDNKEQMNLDSVNNLRIYVQRLIWSAQELANKGVLKPSQLQGVSHQDYEEHKKEFTNLPKQMLAYARKPQVHPPNTYVADKHNQRYGVILPLQFKQKLLAAVNNAKKVVEPSKSLVDTNKLFAAVEQIREAAMECYPGYVDLPQWEPMLLVLQEKLTIEVLETEQYEVYEENASVWWAGKMLDKEKFIKEYCGRNEKTKVIVRLQKFGAQQPQREPPIDGETYKRMVQYYYKKVQESKQFQKKSVQSHYQTIKTESLKNKFHMDNQDIKYKFM